MYLLRKVVKVMRKVIKAFWLFCAYLLIILSISQPIDLKNDLVTNGTRSCVLALYTALDRACPLAAICRIGLTARSGRALKTNLSQRHWI